MTQVPAWRKWVAGLAGVAAAVRLFVLAEGYPTIYIPVLGLFAAAIAVHFAGLGPQLFARAVWWSNLGLGALLCILDGGRSDREAGLVFALACALALVVIGRKGLAEASERAAYVPAAFRGSLLLLMVLALADAQTFALFTAVALDKSEGPAWVPGAASVCFVAGFVGLYRLRLWGAVLNAATALAVIALVSARMVHVHRDLDPVMIVLGVVQLLAAAPMFAAVARGRPLPAPGRRARAIGVHGVILAVVGACVLGYAGVLHVR
jgi:hypothetical protein